MSAYLLFFISMELVLTAGVAAQMISLPYGLMVTELLAILLPAVLFVQMGKLTLKRAFRIRPVSAAVAACALILGVASFPLAIAVSLIVDPAVSAIFGHAPDEKWLLSGFPKSWWLAVGALLPGVCEEILFRGAIQGALERKGAVKAVVITAFLFALFHLNPWNFAGPLLLGLAFGFVTIRCNSIIPAIIWHTVVDATAAAVFVIGGSDENHFPPLWVMLISLAGFAAAGLWFLRLTRNDAHEESPLAFSSGIEAASVRRLAKIVNCALAALIAGCLTCLAVTRVGTDKLAPEIPRGSITLTLKNRFGLIKIAPGDVITYQHEGRRFIRRVTRVAETEVWVSDKSDDGASLETQLSKSEVLAKVIRHFGPPQLNAPPGNVNRGSDSQTAPEGR